MRSTECTEISFPREPCWLTIVHFGLDGSGVLVGKYARLERAARLQ